ncbi:putative ATP-dependent RNA helicase DHR1 [Tilletia horrida]|nr:putative ATP-dependent RNA helicase DHR1 [Tilletia horrida]
MPPKKERFNAKARQSVAGGHSHKKGKGKAKEAPRPSLEALDGDEDAGGAAEVAVAAPTFDPNAAILDEEAKERDRQRRKLLAEAGNDEHMSLSTKKKKRLDKYIASRLKKEERGQILAKLATSSQEVSNRAELKSAATLGTGKVRSVAERVEKLIGKEQKVTGKRKRGAAFEVEEDDDDADLDEDGEEAGRVSAYTAGLVAVREPSIPPANSAGQEPQDEGQTSAAEEAPAPAPSASLAPLPLPVNIGSALALGPDGKPIVTVRKKRTKKPVKKPVAAPSAMDVDESDEEAEGEGAAVRIIQNDDVEPPQASPPKPQSSSRPLLEMAAAVAAPDEVKRSEEGETLQPLLGLSVKVREMMDPEGVARGPLGQQEARPDEISPFAKKVYDESRAAFSSSVASSSKDKLGEAESEAQRAYRALVRNVSVKRSEDLMAARMRLPVVAEEDRIIKTILEHPVVVICGETGSGKTTQVPQFLFEAGFGTPGSLNPGMIGITQPRRVAALSTAARVRSELGLSDSRVSHQIRYDATVSPQTSVKFMTDGVLLREVASDFLLDKYSAILVDEAHERSVNTDVLIGVLSRIVRLREKRWLEGKTPNAKPLRLIIMSATLRVSDFTENKTLFPSPPPVLNIEARQHPVTVHFNRRTTHDYVEEAIKKVGKIHTRLPPGGILVFLTGQQEIVNVCKKLEAKFGRKAIARRKERATGLHWAQRDGSGRARDGADADGGAGEVEKTVLPAGQGDVEAEDVDLNARPGQDSAPLPDALGLDEDGDRTRDEVDAEALDTDSEDGDAADSDGDEDDLGLHKPEPETDVPLHILPLYSLLPSDRQMRVFEEPPTDARVVVVATNVAETSLTIPGIRYVVDCGRAKERQYDLISGVQSFEVGWISKASAAQRAGRAGRTGPGHAYRLYSSAMYEDHFEEFSSPEIVRTPVEGLVLQMKAMNIDQVTHFPFPTAPDRRTIADAERALTRLGALQEAEAVLSSTGADSGGARSSLVARVTELGKVMSFFPVAPRFGKMLVQGRQHGCLPYVVIMVAALTVGDPFIRENVLDEDEDDDDDDDGEEAGDGADGRRGKKGRKETEDPSDPEGIALAALKSEKLRAKEERKRLRKRYFKAQQQFAMLGSGLSDVFRLLSVVGAYEHDGGSVEFCDDNFLRFKAMDEIHKLRAQLSSIVIQALPGLDAKAVAALRNNKVIPPSELQLKVLRQLLCAAFIDQVAVRADLVESAAGLPVGDSNGHWAASRGGHGGPKGAKMRSTRGVPYRALGLGEHEAAYIHPSSILFHQRPPEWLVFSERYRSAAREVRVKKTQQAATGGAEDQEADATERREGKVWLKTCTVINPGWLASLGKKMCTFSKPADGGGEGGGSSTAALVEALRAAKAKGSRTDDAGASAAAAAVSREVVLIPSFGAGLGAAGLGWELPPIKAKQKLVKGRWVTEM